MEYLPAELKTQMFINNEYVDAIDGGTITVLNPSTKKEIC